MPEIDEIHVLGAGRMTRLAVESAAPRHPGVRFTVFSRNPDQHAPFEQANVTLTGVDRATRSTAPLIVGLSADEERILRGSGPGPADRMTVARENVELLDQLALPDLIGERGVVVVVTNPVELVCEFLRRRTGHDAIYGFGMDSDRDRVTEALHHGFGIPHAALRSVTVSGFHALRPIPGLGRLDSSWQSKIMSVNAAQVGERLAGYHSPFSHAPPTIAEHFRRICVDHHGHISRHRRVLSVAEAITRSEFNGYQPPRSRAGRNLAGLMSALVAGGRVRVSGPSPSTSDYFVGGTLDVATGRFTVPRLTEDEQRMLDADQRRFDTYVRRNLP